MPVVKQYQKYTNERRRLYLDYSYWLEPTEELTDFTVTVSPYSPENPLWLDTSFPGGDKKRLMFFAKGGLANVIYTLQLVVTTDEGQIKRDDVQLLVLA